MIKSVINSFLSLWLFLQTLNAEEVTISTSINLDEYQNQQSSFVDLNLINKILSGMKILKQITCQSMIGITQKVIVLSIKEMLLVVGAIKNFSFTE